MNPDLQKQLAEMLAKLTDATQNAASFVMSQAPALVREKILFGRVTFTAEAIVFTGLCVWSVRVCARALKANREDSGSMCDTWIERSHGGALVLSALGSFACFLIALYDIEEAALVWFAPRLYIVEWLKSMVTK